VLVADFLGEKNRENKRLQARPQAPNRMPYRTPKAALGFSHNVETSRVDDGVLALPA
jgi:hypothetical protein